MTWFVWGGESHGTARGPCWLLCLLSGPTLAGLLRNCKPIARAFSIQASAEGRFVQYGYLIELAKHNITAPQHYSTESFRSRLPCCEAEREVETQGKSFVGPHQKF